MIVIGVVIAGGASPPCHRYFWLIIHSVILGKRTYAAWELSRRVLVYLIIFGMVSGDIMLFPCEGAYLLFYEGVVGYMVFDLHILLGQLHCESSPRAS